MNSIASYIGKIFYLLVPRYEETEAENEDVAVYLSTSVKRRPEENTQEEMIKKRKKSIGPASARNDVDPCLSSYLSRSSITNYQKENQQLASDNLNVNQILRREQKSRRVKSPEVYCIDDDDCDQQKQLEIISPCGMTLRSGNCSTSVAKSSSSEDCLILGEVHRTYSRPNKLVLSKVQKMQEQNTLMKMFQNQCSISRKSVPLTNSTVHNTKLNRSVSGNSKNGNHVRYRSLNCPSLSPTNRSSNVIIKPGESAFDKVANVTIDLTNEDDEDQRLAIESKVISSSEIRNMKSSFVAENDSFALDENLISDLTRKYDLKLHNMQTRASKLKKDLENRRAEVIKSVSEILEKRLTLKEHEVEKEDVVQKTSMEIAPVTKEMIREINRILASGKSPLIKIKDTPIELQHIRTLENTHWLNDAVINAYMNLIISRSEENPRKYPKVHCFNTFLYEQLSKRGYMSVRRWTRKVDIFDFEILIIPIHLGNHWCLTQIRFQEKIILYYDSMGSPNNRCLNTMMQYLVEEYKDKKNGVFDSSNWTLKNVPYEELPQQKNAHDCGVFACTFAEHLTRNSPLNFDQDHMRYFRYKMMYEILTGKLLL